MVHLLQATEKSMESPTTHIRFIGVAGNFNSVATLGERMSNGINQLDCENAYSDIVLLPRDFFRGKPPFFNFKDDLWLDVIGDADVVIIVKCVLFHGFERVAPRLRKLCHERGILLVSSPGDGPGAKRKGSREVERFSESIADCVLTISPYQTELIGRYRDPATVKFVGLPTRPHNRTLDVRPVVKSIVWENPVHRDPGFLQHRVAIPHEQFVAVEELVRRVCDRYGARLSIIESWRDDLDDAEWQDTVLSADIAIECKSLGRQYSPYQLQKPAIKIQNYLAMGLPTVCDSLPSYLEVGKSAKVLFADSLAEWEIQLTRLFEDFELRREMSESGLRAAEVFDIPASARRYVEIFESLLEKS